MPRTIAALCLCVVSSCAALRPPKPLSADTRILLNTSDPSSVPACNRPALEVLTLRNQSSRRDAALALSDAWEMADVCAQREHELQAQVDRNGWWQRYGPMLGVVTFFVGAGLGGWIGAEMTMTALHAKER